MKFFIHTTGCKANQWDSHIISHRLRDVGMNQGHLKDSDIVIINACTVTEGAEREIKRFLNKCKRENENAKIVLVGCHAQVYHGNNLDLDLVLGQNEKFIPEHYLKERGVIVSGNDTLSLEGGSIKHLPSSKTRFFLKIQDGCDRFCSYCVVPYARGNPRSRPVKDVIEVMGFLRDMGVKEVVLTGIEIASYYDRDEGLDLKGLLRILENEKTPERIRISSVDPLYIDDRFIEIISASAKIMKSLHLPVQSGSDRILKRMKRPYTKGRIRETILRILDKNSEIGIGVDVIAGFPGEEEKDFMETYELLEGLKIYYFHAFPFSPRKGTEAYLMDGKVPEYIKKERVNSLRKLDSEKRIAFYKRFLNTEQIVLCEGKTYREKYLRGYTSNYIPVYIPLKKGLENKLIKVKIMKLEDGLLFGEVLDL